MRTEFNNNAPVASKNVRRARKSAEKKMGAAGIAAAAVVGGATLSLPCLLCFLWLVSRQQVYMRFSHLIFS